jgi:two-component system, cell cycle sensor histidine kinase and response regulator CckA
MAGNVAGQPLDGGEYACLEVSDTGLGIPDQVQARMFDPFFTTKFTGRGLGLSAALGVIRAHGGALLVNSRPGDGSTFTAQFPAASIAAQTRPRRDSIGMLRGLVLVVDEEELVRETAQTVLQQHGLSVVSAGSGQEGLELFRRIADRLALVVLDLNLPSLNGDAMIAALREIRPGIPILISSGYSESEARQRLTASDGLEFLQKPYGSLELARAVRQAMKV